MDLGSGDWRYADGRTLPQLLGHPFVVRGAARRQASSSKPQAVDMREIIGYKIINKGERNI